MKAIVYNKKASPKLVYSDVEKPIPSDNEILIRVIAASANAADYRSMQLGIIPTKKIFGADLAGIVESVGKNIQTLKPGDEVIGDLASHGFGTFAEYAIAPEEALVLKPSSISFEEAAALPLAAVTALQGLRNKGNIQKGHKVLIAGSGGGVGTYAVQLARHFGADVTAVCSAKNKEQSLSLGASHVIDYALEDFTKSSERYHLIFAVNGNRSLLAYKRMLKPGGRYVMAGGALSQVFRSLIFGKLLSFGTKKMLSLAAKPDQNDLKYISELAEKGFIKAVIERKYPLEKTAEAMKYLTEGHSKAKVVINVAY